MGYPAFWWAVESDGPFIRCFKGSKIVARTKNGHVVRLSSVWVRATERSSFVRSFVRSFVSLLLDGLKFAAP